MRMNNCDTLVNNLTKIFGYGYTNIFSAINNVITEHNMSATQIKIIEYVLINGHAYPTELAEMLNVNKSAVTQVLKKLELKALIEVKENTLTDDKRAKLIYLTPEAKIILKRLTHEITVEVQKSIDHLHDNERSELRQATDVMMKHLLGGTINEKNFTI